jgi:hypothetical protein
VATGRSVSPNTSRRICMEEICSQMKANNYSYNVAAALKAPYSQLMSLQNTYAQLSIGKTAIKWVRKIARQDTFSQHSFNAKVRQSISEETVKCYVIKCWCCDQSGRSYANKQDQITSLNRDKPGVQEKAAKLRRDLDWSPEKEEKWHKEEFKMQHQYSALRSLWR